MDIHKASVLTVFFTTLLVMCRIGSFIATPLWLDSFNSSNHSQHDNLSVTSNHSACVHHRTNPFFIVFVQTIIPFIFFSICLVLLLLCRPSLITPMERNYPKRLFFIPGILQASSIIMVNYTVSGQRTAPYLQAVLNNFSIPIQFILRFLLLRKYPTKRKTICTIAVMAAEFTCLIPSIFPSLESEKQHQDEGGASGAGRILWPLCFVLFMVPYAINNIYVEKTVKDKGDEHSSGSLNMVYYMFWYTLAVTMGSCLFVWVDVLPGFGTSDSFKDFGKMFWFNVLCFVGQEDCGPGIYLLAWAVVFSNMLAYLSLAYLLRYSEGSNYMIVAMTLRSPLLFLFWTLFSEHPFYWHPHTSLSTWLSLGALTVMVPAVIIYNTGPREKDLTSKTKEQVTQCEDHQPLIDDDDDQNDTQTIQ